jgi:hypothetical protein
MLDQALTVTTQQTVEATAATAMLMAIPTVITTATTMAITTEAKVLNAAIQLTPEIMTAGNAAP